LGGDGFAAGGRCDERRWADSDSVTAAASPIAHANLLMRSSYFFFSTSVARTVPFDWRVPSTFTLSPFASALHDVSSNFVLALVIPTVDATLNVSAGQAPVLPAMVPCSSTSLSSSSPSTLVASTLPFD